MGDEHASTSEREPVLPLAAVSGTAEVTTDPLIGELLDDRYLVERVLGRGAMGVVYAARHVALDQLFAIKVLPSAFSTDEDSLRRFEREARAASRVRHPNVVHTFDLGRLPTGEPYLAMEMLDGHDLEQEMAASGLPAPEVLVGWVCSVAAALDALHSEGFVHRDIKPSNVFLARTTAGRCVKLVDFGLAALAMPSAGSQRLTRVDQVVGTPAYLPPETARGELCGPRGDVYSLGVLAFEALTGALPFDGEPLDVMLRKIAEPAPSLAANSDRPFSSDVERVVARALERDPALRPETAGRFADALAIALLGAAPRPTEPAIEMPEERPTLRTVKRAARPSRIAGLALLMVSAVAVACALAATSGPRPSTPIAQSIPLAATPPAGAPALTLTLSPVPVPAFTPAPPLTPAPVPTPAPRARHPGAAPPLALALPPTPAPALPPTPAPALAPAPVPTPPADPVALARQASTAMVHGQVALARSLYEEATQLAPTDPTAWRGLGLACERSHVLPEARRAYERYLDLAPTAADAPTVRARLDRLL